MTSAAGNPGPRLPCLFEAHKREIAACEGLTALTAAVHRAARAYGLPDAGQLQPDTWERYAEALGSALPDLTALINIATLRREFLGEPRSAMHYALRRGHDD